MCLHATGRGMKTSMVVLRLLGSKAKAGAGKKPTAPALMEPAPAAPVPDVSPAASAAAAASIEAPASVPLSPAVLSNAMGSQAPGSTAPSDVSIVPGPSATNPVLSAASAGLTSSDLGRRDTVAAATTTPSVPGSGGAPAAAAAAFRTSAGSPSCVVTGTDSSALGGGVKTAAAVTAYSIPGSGGSTLHQVANLTTNASESLLGVEPAAEPSAHTSASGFAPGLVRDSALGTKPTSHGAGDGHESTPRHDGGDLPQGSLSYIHQSLAASGMLSPSACFIMVAGACRQRVAHAA